MESEEMTCPRCSAEMAERDVGGAHVHQCPEGHGVFLERADLGGLIEGESEFHRSSGHHTQPLPRITADMTAPPPMATRSRAFIETLFG
jgi:Zn-finger nucleic acid-binding protein